MRPSAFDTAFCETTTTSPVSSSACSAISAPRSSPSAIAGSPSTGRILSSGKGQDGAGQGGCSVRVVHQRRCDYRTHALKLDPRSQVRVGLVEDERVSLGRKLENPQFVERAKPEVVVQARQRVLELEERRAKMMATLDELGRLP